MIYSFDEEVAKEVGVNAAIIMDKFTWWIRQNEANERNFYDGRYWTYNSTKALTSMFPFFSAKQIGRILKKLIDDGYLLTGNYNKVAEACGNSLHKGSKVAVVGKLTSRQYDNSEGKKVTVFEIVADAFGGVEFLDKKQGGSQSNEIDETEEIPF